MGTLIRARYLNHPGPSPRSSAHRARPGRGTPRSTGKILSPASYAELIAPSTLNDAPSPHAKGLAQLPSPGTRHLARQWHNGFIHSIATCRTTPSASSCSGIPPAGSDVGEAIVEAVLGKGPPDTKAPR
jgi:hypothetical protein